MKKLRVAAVVVGVAALAAAGVAGYRHMAERSIHERATDAVRRALNDPESARFDRVTYNAATLSTCGLVNAKNRMGGYVGFTRFVVNMDGAAEFQPPEPPTYGALDERQAAADRLMAFLTNYKIVCQAGSP